MGQGTRADLLGLLAGRIGSAATAHPVRVAIDGPPAAGKTTLAEELEVVLRAQGREVIRASIDDFLVPREQRYRRGRFSAEGNYYDAHDRDAMCRELLDPLGPGGNRQFRTAIYDRETDATLSLPAATASADAVLLFDGVFLLRPELLGRWDLTVLITVDFERTLERAKLRGTALAGLPAAAAEIERSWRHRYLPSQQLYAADARPADHAGIVVNNDDLARPTWKIRQPGGKPPAQDG